jgi:hypothetical protein
MLTGIVVTLFMSSIILLVGIGIASAVRAFKKPEDEEGD